MNLRTGLVATGIAVSAFSGAATGPAGLNEGLRLLPSSTLFASMAPTQSKTHKVLSGENDWTIAKKYGVSVAALHAANPDTKWRALQIGQTLTIPGGSTTAAVKASGGTHTVKKGENDTTIARKYGVTVGQIHAVNPGVDWRKLQIGSKVKLPGGAEDTSKIKAITTNKVKIAAGTVNVRTEPSTSSTVRVSVPRGTTATVLDRQGAWYELRFPKGTTGWVRGDMLSAVAQRPAAKSSGGPKTTEVAYLTPINADLASQIIDTAMDMLGVEYVWGGTSRGGVDCSGLTTYVFARNGIRLPRTSIEQSQHGEWVPMDEIEAGDLLFFITGRRSSRINHVGLYIGDGKFIHASSYNHRVLVTSLKEYRSQFAGARRVSALQTASVLDEPEGQIIVQTLFPSRIVYGADKTGR